MAEVTHTLRGRTVLVTGATGLIGAALVRRLVAGGEASTVYAACRNIGRAQALFGPETSRLRFVPYEAERPLAGDTAYDYIIHAASGASPAQFQADPVGVMMANIVGLRLLLDYGRAHQMRRLLYLSTGEVYGQGEAEQWTEEMSGYVDSMSPRSCYPASKRAAETLVASYHAQYGTDALVARLCHTYGPGFTPADNRAYAQFLRRAAAGEDIVMKSAGGQYRAWLYVEDAVDALLVILARGLAATAYNVASEASTVTIRQLAETIAREAGCRVVFDIDAGAAPAPIRRAVFSTARLRALGWTARHTLGEGVRATLAALTGGAGL